MELLANPDVVALIRAAAAPAPVPVAPIPPVKPSPLKKTAAKVSTAVKTGVGKAAKAVKAAAKTVAKKASAAWSTVKSAGRVVRTNPRVKKAVIIGAGVGVVSAVIAATNHSLATTMSGIGAAVTAIAVQGGLWLRTAGRRLGLV
jgi:hypothetical protein